MRTTLRLVASNAAQVALFALTGAALALGLLALR
jgi:hypothetical protein